MPENQLKPRDLGSRQDGEDLYKSSDELDIENPWGTVTSPAAARDTHWSPTIIGAGSLDPTENRVAAEPWNAVLSLELNKSTSNSANFVHELESRGQSSPIQHKQQQNLVPGDMEKCPVCETPTTGWSRDKVKNHMKTHVLVVNIKLPTGGHATFRREKQAQIQCVCLTSFKTRQGLVRHLERCNYTTGLSKASLQSSESLEIVDGVPNLSISGGLGDPLIRAGIGLYEVHPSCVTPPVEEPHDPVTLAYFNAVTKEHDRLGQGNNRLGLQRTADQWVQKNGFSVVIDKLGGQQTIWATNNGELFQKFTKILDSVARDHLSKIILSSSDTLRRRILGEPDALSTKVFSNVQSGATRTAYNNEVARLLSYVIQRARLAEDSRAPRLPHDVVEVALPLLTKMEAGAEVTELVVDLLCRLFLRKVPLNSPNTDHPVYVWLALESVTSSGGYRPVARDRKCFSALLHWMRSVLLMAVLNPFSRIVVEKTTGQQYVTCDVSDDCHRNQTSLDMERILEFGNLQSNCTISMLIWLMTAAKSVKDGELRSPAVIWDPSSNDSSGFPAAATVNNERTSVTTLMESIAIAKRESKERLQELLFGLSLTRESLTSLMNLEDELQNTSVGYGVASNQEGLQQGGVLFQASTTVFRRAWGTPTLRQQLWDSQGCLKEQRARKYLDDTVELLHFFQFLVHVTSGIPFRQTEELELRVRNSPSSMRNLYLMDKRVVLITSYSKNSSKMGRDIVNARELPRCVSELLMEYLVYCLPFARYLTSCLDGAPLAGQDDWGEYLFVHQDRKQLRADQARLIFNAISHKLGYISLSSHRQFIIACAQMRRLVVDEDQNPIGEQAGHSKRIDDEEYGVSNLDSRIMTTEKMHERRKTSRAVHVLLGLGDDKMHQGPRNLATDSHLSSEEKLDKILHLLQGLQRKGSNSVAAPPALEEAPMPNPKKAKTIIDHFSPSRLLRAFNLENFRTEAQRILVRTVFEAKPGTTTLGVLPTGSGKTLAILGPCKLQHDKASLVVTPLVNLRQELVERARSAGILATNVQEWQTGPLPRGLMVTTPEQLANVALMQAIKESTSQGVLTHVFVDEVHQILTEVAYRPYMADNIRRVIDLALSPETPVKLRPRIILLTGTLPPRLASSVVSSIGLEGDVRTIRDSSVIPNHRYRLVKESGRAVMDCAAELAAGLSHKTIVFLGLKSRIPYLKKKLETISDHEVCTFFASQDASQSAQLEEDKRRFQSGTATVMLSTIALAVGFDCPSVRNVIVAGDQVTSSLLSIAQMFGRAGRDGSEANCIMISDGTLPGSAMDDPLASLLKESPRTCFRAHLSRDLDNNAVTCSEQCGHLLCDACRPQHSALVPVVKTLNIKPVHVSEQRRATMGIDSALLSEIQINNEICGVCLALEGVKNKRSILLADNCPKCESRMHCFYCAGEHAAKQCGMKPHTIFQHSICYCCLLPCRVPESSPLVARHRNNKVGRNCDVAGGRFLKHFVLTAFQKYKVALASRFDCLGKKDISLRDFLRYFYTTGMANGTSFEIYKWFREASNRSLLSMG